MLRLAFLALLAASRAAACGANPVAANASCCECAGFTGDAHACHWCPPPIGGCKYFGSPEYRCAGFVAERAACPGAPCAPLSASASATPTPTPTRTAGGPPPASPSGAPSRAPPAPLRPFSKKGVGYFGGACGDFGAAGLSNISCEWHAARDAARRASGQRPFRARS